MNLVMSRKVILVCYGYAFLIVQYCTCYLNSFRSLNKGRILLSMTINDFNHNPESLVGSQRNMLGRQAISLSGVFAGLYGASVLTKGSLAQAADDLCDSCKSSSTESSVCAKCLKNRQQVATSLESSPGYNPLNERIYDTYHQSYLPARPELYLTNDRLEGVRVVAVGKQFLYCSSSVLFLFS